jgi:hypothetical protein
LAEWSPGTGNVAWTGIKRLKVARQKKLADAVGPQLQADERILAILSTLFERVYKRRGASGVVAIVVTNSRLFVIRRRRMTGRVKEIDASYARADLKVDWTRNAFYLAGQPDTWCGRLTFTGPFRSRDLWAVGYKRQSLTEATARTLAE